MTDLAEFLHARYDERAAKARAALHDGEGRWKQADPLRYPGLIEDERRETVVYDEGRPSEEQAAHIAENDPAGVLREVEAKRRILDAFEAKVDRRQVLGVMHDAELAKGDEYAPELVAVMGQGIAANIWARHLYWVIQVMALPYSDHEEFKDEWRP